MAWSDYFRFGGVEIVNATRTATYASALGLSWVKNDGLKPNPALPPMLGQHDGYVAPWSDPAPWYEADDDNSWRFAGAVPISVVGIEDSTREADAFEFTGNGGRSIGLRSSTKEVVFSLALIGKNEAAVEYGHRWLKRALEQRICVPKGIQPCVGEDLQFASARPSSALWTPDDMFLDGGTPPAPGGPPLPGIFDGGNVVLTEGATETELEAEWAKWERNLRDVTLIRGPSVTSKRTFGGDCGGCVWVVQFTLRAGDPFEYGPQIPFLRDFGEASDPYVSSVDGDAGENTFTWEDCGGPGVVPITDPNCSPLDPPPGPPRIGRGCFDFPTGTWSRAYAKIPRRMIPRWDEVRPIFFVTSDDDAERMIRLRIFSGGAVPTENCGSLGGVVISYIPASTELVVDNSREMVLGRNVGESRYRRADALAAHWLGGPVEWYGMSCDRDYYLVMDWPGTGDPAVSVDVDFVARTF